jgi:GNAT superfamily N-acetyltransferase
MAAFDAVWSRRRYPGALPEPVDRGARCLLAWRGGEPVARLSYRAARGLQGAPGRFGLVGHYEAWDAAAGVALLLEARARLARAGVARVVGPMNGSTWARYRLALPARRRDPRFDPPSFLTEPQNAPGYPGHFRAAGFREAARYESRIADALADAPAAAACPTGVTVRALDPAREARDLAAIFRLSRAAFAGNPYYAPLPFSRFRAGCAGLRPLIDPDLVRLAHDEAGCLVAFAVALPDVLSGGRRVVLKTLAVAPAARGRGLGRHLVAEVHRLARARGARAVIHALMHVGNASMRLSAGQAGQAGQVFRRYALYEWAPELPAGSAC